MVSHCTRNKADSGGLWGIWCSGLPLSLWLLPLACNPHSLGSSHIQVVLVLPKSCCFSSEAHSPLGSIPLQTLSPRSASHIFCLWVCLNVTFTERVWRSFLWFVNCLFAHYCWLEIISLDQLAGRSQQQELGVGMWWRDLAERNKTKDQGARRERKSEY